MTEKAKIQRQLQKLREESVKEYLADKLATITGQQVAHDILEAFLQANNQQFMGSIAESIEQARRDNAEMSQTIEKMKQTHLEQLKTMEQQIVRTNQQLNQNKIKEITVNNSNKLSEMQAKCQQLQQQSLIMKNVIQELEKEKEMIKSQRFHQKNEDEKAVAEIKLKMIELMEHKQAEKNQMQQLLKYETIKNQQKQRQLLLLQQQLTLAKQESLHNTLQLEKIIFQNKEQLNKYYQQLIIKQTQIVELQFKIKQLTNQLQCSKLEKEEVNLSKQKIEEDYTNILQRNTQLDQQLNEINQQLKNTINTVQQLSHKGIALQQSIEQINCQHNQHINLLNSQKQTLQLLITQMQQQFQIKLLSQATTTELTIKQIVNKSEHNLQQLQQQKWRLYSENEQYKQQLKQVHDQNTQILKDLQSVKEEIKTQITYNSINQKEMEIYQQEIKRISQECRNQICAYRQTYELTCISKEQQLSLQRQRSMCLTLKMQQLTEELCVWAEKEKYYQLYLAEIGQLKKELEQYKPTKNNICYRIEDNQISLINIKTHWFSTFSSILFELKQIKNQNRSLKSSIQLSMNETITYVNAVVDLIVNQAKQQFIKCSYCQHQKLMLVNAGPSIKLQLERTKPKVAKVTNQFSQIKKNLRTIQQKYQTINGKNNKFTNYIDTIIDKQ